MKNCKSCEYGFADELADIYCVNDKSESCTEYVGPYFKCDNFVKKVKQDGKESRINKFSNQSR